VAGDAIRNITGFINGVVNFKNAGGVFSFGDGYGFSFSNQVQDNTGYNTSSFVASMVVPTGADNSPRTLSSRFWRRVA
jgi:hypothetical protein